MKADTQPALQYDTLPVGYELSITLQELTVRSDMVDGQRVIGEARVRVQQRLGHGGMADAYLCQLLSFKPAVGIQGSSRVPDKVVVKLQHPVLTSAEVTPGRFLKRAMVLMWQECNLLNSLSRCVHVIDTYGFGMAAAVDGSSLYGLGQSMPCILLQHAELGDLWQCMQRDSDKALPMSARDTKMVVYGVMGALAALHGKGYIHPDVKPDNVLVFKQPGSKRPQYKLCDFNLAALAKTWPPNKADGTPAYKPPEKYWLISSDTYSLGRLILACRSAAVPKIGTYEEMRASGDYDNLPDPMRDVEWELLQVCLTEQGGNRPDAATLFDHTS